MSKEFRYQGRTDGGKLIQGFIVADNIKKAKEITHELASQHSFNVTSLLPKRTFLYVVKIPKGKKIKGRQAAYTKEELSAALAKVGYANAFIEPMMIDFKMKPSFQSIVMFINMSSFMLKEGTSYDKILQMLAEEEANPVLKESLRKIQSELKRGKQGSEVFPRYADVFGKFPAYMLGLATKSGNMSEVYDATAKFMERDMEYRKNLRQALLQPAIMVLATIAALLYYILDIFPSTAKLFERFEMQIPIMTRTTLDFSNYMLANWWWQALIVAIPTVLITMWFGTPKGRVWRDRMMIKIPILGPLLHKSSIEIFFRVFAAIYSSAENNVDTLRSAAEACRNAWMEKRIKEVTIPLMLKEGMGLLPALAKAGVFNKATLSRIRSGSETGNILASSKQIYRFYEKETSYKMENLIQSIQSFIGLFIGIAITMLTLVSGEIAMVSPKTPGM